MRVEGDAVEMASELITGALTGINIRPAPGSEVGQR